MWKKTVLKIVAEITFAIEMLFCWEMQFLMQNDRLSIFIKTGKWDALWLSEL